MRIRCQYLIKNYDYSTPESVSASIQLFVYAKWKYLKKV